MRKFILRHPWVFLGFNAVVTLFFSLQLPRAVLDNDLTNFIPVESPARKAYSEMEDVFGGQLFMLAALYKPTGSLLEADDLALLEEITSRMERLPYVEEVTSLTHSDYITSEGENIVVTQLLPDAFTGTPEEIRELKRRLASWELYRNTILNNEGNAVQIIVRMGVATTNDGGEDPKVVVYNGVTDILNDLVPETHQSFVSGMPAITATISSSMQHDLVLLIPLVVLVLVGTLVLSFRKAVGVVLPLLSVVVSSIWSMGLMALLEVRLTLIATVIPVIMVAVGSAYGIHLVTHYLHDLREKPTKTKEEHLELIEHAMAKVGTPVLLAALTTIAGFGSLSLTEILPIRDFGLFSSFGVLAALIASMTVIPSLLVLLGPQIKPTQEEHTTKTDHFSLVLSMTLGGINRRPGITLTIAAMLVVLSVIGSRHVIVDNAIVEFFPKDSEIAKSDVFLNERFAGTKTFSLVFSSPTPGGLTDPRVLAVMDETARWIEESYPAVGKVTGFHQLIMRINQVFNADRTEPFAFVQAAEVAEPEFGFSDEPTFGFEDATFPETVAPILQPTPIADRVFTDYELTEAIYASLTQGETSSDQALRSLLRKLNLDGFGWYEIPLLPEKYGQADIEGLKRVVSNYLLLLSDGTEGWADDPLEPRQARLNIQLRDPGTNITAQVSEAALAFARERLPEGFSVTLAGAALIEKTITDLIVRNQFWNILQSLGAVFLILALTNKSLAAGLIGILPLALSLAINFAFMGFFQIKLNVGTAMVASIAIGVGIDYTIHFLSALKWEAARHLDWDHVVRRSLMTSGKAIIFNAASVGLGFLVLIFSRFQPLIHLGALIGLTMATTSLASMTLLPVLFRILKPRFLFPKTIKPS